MRRAFRLPSGRARGTMNMPRPREPGPCPGTRARVRMTSALTFEQNHLWPRSVQWVPWSLASVSVMPMSVPACFSVMNIAPVADRLRSVELSASISAAKVSGSNILRTRAAESVIDTGHASPNSAWTNR